MLWYLIGFAVGAGALGALWWLLRKLDARFTWRGTEWIVGLLVAAVLAGCAAAPKDSAPAKPAAQAIAAPLAASATPGSAANPIFYRDPVLEALLTQIIAVSKPQAPAPQNPAVAAVPKPEDPKPENPSYFWRRAGFDLGVAFGAAAFAAAWWFFLKREA